VNGLTFDAGGLIALDRDNRVVLSLIARARAGRLRIAIPATALAQAMRNPGRQFHLWRLMRHPETDVVALDNVDATDVGVLLAWTRTADIADAHVVLCARRAGHTVVTSDVGDLRRLAPELKFIAV